VSTRPAASPRRERVLQVSDLGALPPGRALVLASGTKPVLVETIPWWEGPYAGEVQASLKKYDPGASRVGVWQGEGARRVTPAGPFP
jgi:hypothetical protein